MLLFTRDFEIPQDGINDKFKINAYSSFAIELLNMVKEDKKLIKIYEIKEWQGEKEYDEAIQIKDENDNIINGIKKIKKNVISYIALLSSNDKRIVNSKKLSIKRRRKLPKIEKQSTNLEIKDDAPISIKPSAPVKLPKPVKPPKVSNNDTIPSENSKLVKQ